MSMFGTAGVRGVFNLTQTPEQVYDIAETAAFAFGKGDYGIGWDGRKSSAALAKVVASGVSSVGSDSILFGLVPTPVTAYGTRERGCRLGFSVTASHNPPEFSGVKIFNGRGIELSREEELRVERAMAVESSKRARTMGAVDEGDVLESYVSELISRFEPASTSMKIVVDCGNGPGSLVSPRVLSEMGHKVMAMNAQISWRFPSRLPEPTAENLKDTAAVVTSCGADFGFAHDGDADRLVMINGGGEVLPDSIVSSIALRAVAGQSGTVILSENTSMAVEEVAADLGLRVIRAKVGKTSMEVEKEGAAFATEPSKIVDPRWGLWEDGMYCAALIADAIAKDRRLLEVLSSPPAWHYRQLNLPVAVNFESLTSRIEEELSEFRILEVRRLDGLKVVFKDESWIMFRPSGTEPKTRVYCEARDELRLEELHQRGKKIVHESETVGSRM